MEGNYRGVLISEIRGAEKLYRSPEFPKIPEDINNHAVLFIPNNGHKGQPPQPKDGPDMWDIDFVKLPCSKRSEYSVKGSKKYRWDVIRQALSKNIRNVQDLIDTIMSYNKKYEKTWSFRTLRELFNEECSVLTEDEIGIFFNTTLPDIAKLALRLPELIRGPIPLLKQKKNYSISMSQEQISSLLANAFFCTFPSRNSKARNSEYSSYPHINFASLFEARGDDVIEKLKCIIHYFQRVCRNTPVGVVTFTRRSVTKSECPAWNSDIPLSTVKLHVDADGSIERSAGLIQLDFANKYLGGGVLNHGSVQEEIRFVICPELMVSMLFTEMLLSEEAVLIIGAEQYSKYIGYSRSFQFMGRYDDPAPLDTSNRRKVAVLAIDALSFQNKKQEYKVENIVRELNKAWVGFSIYCDRDSKNITFPGVATGNWGCGAFGGSPQLKALIQLMACAESGRPMAYLTFGDAKFRDEFYDMYEKLRQHCVTVGQLFMYIKKFAKEDSQLRELFSFLNKELSNEGRCKRFKRKISPPDTMKNEKGNDVMRFNDSPDFFSQDEGENLQSSIKGISKRSCQNNTFNESWTESDVEMAILEEDLGERDIVLDEIEVNNCKVKVENNINVTANTSRLFEEMDKLDGDSKLNVSLSHKSLLNESPKVTFNKKVKPANLKRKSNSNHVITHYFPKKPKK